MFILSFFLSYQFMFACDRWFYYDFMNDTIKLCLPRLRLLEISVDEQTRRGCAIWFVLNWSRNRHELHLCACKVEKDRWTEGKWKERISSVTRLTGSNAYISTHSTNFYCIRLRTCIHFVRPSSLFSVLFALHSLRTGIITGVGTGRTLLTV